MKTFDKIIYLCEEEKNKIYVDGMEPAPKKWKETFNLLKYYKSTLSDSEKEKIKENTKIIFKNLKDCPKEVKHGSFICYDDNLEVESLEGGPKKVDFSYYIKSNLLKSLEGGPTEASPESELNCEHCPKISKEEVIRYSKENPDIPIDSKYGKFMSGCKLTIGPMSPSKKYITELSKKYPDEIFKTNYGYYKNGKKIKSLY